jgi:hypothetical protein
MLHVRNFLGDKNVTNVYVLSDLIFSKSNTHRIFQTNFEKQNYVNKVR